MFIWLTIWNRVDSNLLLVVEYKRHEQGLLQAKMENRAEAYIQECRSVVVQRNEVSRFATFGIIFANRDVVKHANALRKWRYELDTSREMVFRGRLIA